MNESAELARPRRVSRFLSRDTRVPIIWHSDDAPKIPNKSWRSRNEGRGCRIATPAGEIRDGIRFRFREISLWNRKARETLRIPLRLHAAKAAARAVVHFTRATAVRSGRKGRQLHRQLGCREKRARRKIESILLCQYSARGPGAHSRRSATRQFQSCSTSSARLYLVWTCPPRFGLAHRSWKAFGRCGCPARSSRCPASCARARPQKTRMRRRTRGSI